MKRKLIICLVLGVSIVNFRLKAQPNCEVYKAEGNITKYKACKKSEEIADHYQFSKEYQEILDEAILIDPSFDFPYRRKSVAYLKSGDFVNWKKLIDKAVSLNPQAHLGARGWCRFSWFRDYEGAISDIEELDGLIDYDIGETTDGRFHLHLVRALSYNAMGNNEKALVILNDLVEKKGYRILTYDWFYLGLLYFEEQKFNQAKECFLKQKSSYDFSSNSYYLALVSSKLNLWCDYESYLEESLDKYSKGYTMQEDYNHAYKNVFLSDIEEELNRNTGKCQK